MKRRDFIQTILSGGTVLTIPTWCQALNNPQDKLSTPSTLAQLWDSNTLTDIGFKYRASSPTENNEDLLVNLLTKAHMHSTDIDIHQAIEQDIEQDYKTERTCVIDGWVLSITEARQCALFSLKQTV